MNPGALVKYRERDWLVLPSDEPEVLLLRPIGGSGREICAVHKPLANLLGYQIEYERIRSSHFPLPDSQSVQDHAAVRLLIDAARLLLRDGAAPFRSFGKLSVRPRPYQLVPLIMALRLDVVRMLIADDVGVGKTIEAGLIARELLDRGIARRLAVLCPPYLCDQWKKELAEKFDINAAVVRSGTVSRLETQKPPDRTIFQHYPHLVVSIDLVKGDRYRRSFLQQCPGLVIVDEVHGAARPAGLGRAQQERHELLTELASNTDRHLILLTATPHSGVEESFLSILGLLKPKFRQLDIGRLAERERIELARHFVQRRRGDVKRWLGEDTAFPERINIEIAYEFGRAYKDFFDDVYKFAAGLVRSAEALTGWKRRMRFWSALALLRCVGSSPAAAEVALLKRARGEEVAESPLDLDASTEEELAAEFEPLVHDPTEVEVTSDAPPASVFDAQEQDGDFSQTDRRRLRGFAREAESLRGAADLKLQGLIEAVRHLLNEGLHPIIWCRYIETADYVASEVALALRDSVPDLRVESITGTDSEDVRKLKVAALSKQPCRVLVATDCLSEGINLQEAFNAVVHYDLPWNPNRLEQREGRVDRFGQTAPTVKAVLVFGKDNPVDGAVLEVLLRKAKEIYRRLGVHVPVPIDSETVLEAVLRSLFTRARPAVPQMTLFDLREESVVHEFHDQWDRAESREKESRTRFAQHAIKPEEVERELDETDRVLGAPDDVRSFLLEGSQRLGFSLVEQRNGIWELQPAGLPSPVRQRLGTALDHWKITFNSPTPEGVTFVGRNHALVEALAEHVVDLAFHPAGDLAPAARCGVIRTNSVTHRTTLLLLRIRFLLYERGSDKPSLAEETLAWGFTGLPPDTAVLDLDEARLLIDTVRPGANVAAAEKQEVLDETLSWWAEIQPAIKSVIEQRARSLYDSHRRARELLGEARLRVEPQYPPDLLGALVLLPVPRGIKR
jgi:superfamily II DNA or RNA helicase